MRRKIGRNDPCPCGSGKKYKHCCLVREEATDLEWRRLRRADDRFAGELFRYALDRYGEGLLEAAWEEFLLGLKVDVAPRDHPDFPTTFVPWFLFIWSPDPGEPEAKARRLPPRASRSRLPRGPASEARRLREALRSRSVRLSVLFLLDSRGRARQRSPSLGHPDAPGSLGDRSLGERDGTARIDPLREGPHARRPIDHPRLFAVRDPADSPGQDHRPSRAARRSGTGAHPGAPPRVRRRDPRALSRNRRRDVAPPAPEAREHRRRCARPHEDVLRSLGVTARGVRSPRDPGRGSHGGRASLRSSLRRGTRASRHLVQLAPSGKQVAQGHGEHGPRADRDRWCAAHRRGEFPGACREDPLGDRAPARGASGLQASRDEHHREDDRGTSRARGNGKRQTEARRESTNRVAPRGASAGEGHGEAPMGSLVRRGDPGPRKSHPARGCEDAGGPRTPRGAPPLLRVERIWSGAHGAHAAGRR